MRAWFLSLASVFPFSCPSFAGCLCFLPLCDRDAHECKWVPSPHRSEKRNEGYRWAPRRGGSSREISIIRCPECIQVRRSLAVPTTSCQDERTWKGWDLLGECQRPSLAFHLPYFLPLAQNGPEPFNSVAPGVSFPTLQGIGLPLLVFSEPVTRELIAWVYLGTRWCLWVERKSRLSQLSPSSAYVSLT